MLRTALFLLTSLLLALANLYGQGGGPLLHKFHLLATPTDAPTVINDSTYQLSFTFFADQTGQNYSVDSIQIGDRLVFQNEQHYRVDGVTPQGFTDGRLSLVRLPGTAGAPAGSEVAIVYRYGEGSPFIPMLPRNSGGIPQSFATVLENHNFSLTVPRISISGTTDPYLKASPEDPGIQILGDNGLTARYENGALRLIGGGSGGGSGGSDGVPLGLTTTETPDSLVVTLALSNDLPDLVTTLPRNSRADLVTVAAPLAGGTVQAQLESLQETAGGITRRLLLADLPGLELADIEWSGVTTPSLTGSGGEFSLTIPAGTRVFSVTIRASDAEAATNGSSGFNLAINNFNTQLNSLGNTVYLQDHHQLTVVDHDGYDVVDTYASANFYYRQVPGANGLVTHRLLSVGTALSSGFTLVLSR